MVDYNIDNMFADIREKGIYTHRSRYFLHTIPGYKSINSITKFENNFLDVGLRLFRKIATQELEVTIISLYIDRSD